MNADLTPKRPRVLVVARDPSLRRSTWKEIEGLGCAVETVTDEVEALGVVETRGDEFHVAVVDGEFKLLTAAEIAERISHIAPRVRVVICTDRPAVLPRATAIARLATASVPGRLVDAVRQALSRRASLDVRRPAKDGGA